ncbi:hypothetical protein QBC44DRAFT_321791 [Cladorrhinum sp. PSN332]|nr:hypothetical protein QBC44DRAFT_321791 [Cladorrhinum sp. PSN332]
MRREEKRYKIWRWFFFMFFYVFFLSCLFCLRLDICLFLCVFCLCACLLVTYVRASSIFFNFILLVVC